MPAHSATPAQLGRHVRRGDARLSRILAVVVMSAVLPGSGHLVTGHRRAGRLIMGIFFVLVVLAAAVGVLAYVSPETVASFAVRTSWLAVLQWGVLALGVAWASVIGSSALYAHPGSVGRGGRLVALALTAALCVGIAIPVLRISQYADTTATVIDDVFTGEDPGPAANPGLTEEEVFFDGRVNVLLVGADSDRRDDLRTGLRTDTVIVASIDAETGRTLLFTLPRNMQQMPFPEGSAMDEEYPEGFGSCGSECMLNAIHTHATELAELDPTAFPGDTHPGMTALQGAVGEALGLDIDYYALVNLEGFERIVDALGGVTINVDERLPIGGLDADGNEVRPSGYIEPGLQTLDGFDALWYARSRSGGGDDYKRSARQRCLLGAVLREAEPRNLLVSYQQVVRSAPDAVETDIPRDVLPELVRVGFRVREQPVESLAFVPPLVPDTADPDYDVIRTLVEEAIARSDAAAEAPVNAAPTPGAGEPADEGTDGESAGAAGEEPADDPSGTASAAPEAPVDEAVDLASVCTFS